jgi:hypothetical protein
MKISFGRSSAAVIKVKTASDKGQRVSHRGSTRAGSTRRTTPWRVRNRCEPSPVSAPPELSPTPHSSGKEEEEGRGPQAGPKETAELPARPPPTSLGPVSSRRARDHHPHPEAPRAEKKQGAASPEGTKSDAWPTATSAIVTAHPLLRTRSARAQQLFWTLRRPRWSRGSASSYWPATADGDQSLLFFFRRSPPAEIVAPSLVSL